MLFFFFLLLLLLLLPLLRCVACGEGRGIRKCGKRMGNEIVDLVRG